VSEDDVTEDERLERVRILKASAPDGVDIEGLLGGSLAGPVNPDRPNVPPWEYPEYAAAHPGVTWEELARVRFPVRLQTTGYTFPSSIHELAKPGVTPDSVPTTLLDAVDFLLEMRAAGAWRWDAADRIVIADEDVAPDAATLHAAWRDRIARRPE